MMAEVSSYYCNYIIIITDRRMSTGHCVSLHNLFLLSRLGDSRSLNRRNSAADCSISLQFGTLHPMYFRHSRSSNQRSRSQRENVV